VKTERKARITGMGSYVPERVLTNLDLESMVETSDEWIVQRTGISERRVAAADEAASHMGCQAAKQALARSGLNPRDVDLVLVATMTGDFTCPATAPLIQSELSLITFRQWICKLPAQVIFMVYQSQRPT
jgi:3-oxoacyl-[acyl-carrier-protein] synthase-3